MRLLIPCAEAPVFFRKAASGLGNAIVGSRQSHLMLTCDQDPDDPVKTTIDHNVVFVK